MRDWASRLDLPFGVLDLPRPIVRLARERNLDSVRDLVLLWPEVPELEDALGERVVLLVERALLDGMGASWRELYRAVAGPVSTQWATRPRFVRWDALRRRAPDTVRALRIVDVPDLALGFRRLARRHRVATLGELFALTWADALRVKGTGPEAWDRALLALDRLVDDPPPPRPDPLSLHASWRALFEAQLADLPERDAVILRLRAGLDGRAPTLREVGAAVGISRERVRQIEARALERLRASATWTERLETRLGARLGSATFLPLARLGELDAFFRADPHELGGLAFWLTHLLPRASRVFERDGVLGLGA